MFRHSPQSAILNSMRFAPIVSMLVMSLALNAQTLQGKVVRVADGDEDTITILDGRMVRANTNPIPPWEFRKARKEESL